MACSALLSLGCAKNSAIIVFSAGFVKGLSAVFHPV